MKPTVSPSLGPSPSEFGSPIIPPAPRFEGSLLPNMVESAKFNCKRACTGGCRFKGQRGQDELSFESSGCIGPNPVFGNWRIGAEDKGRGGEVQHPLLWFAWT